MAKIAAIGDFHNYAREYGFVSFDLFDTLIKRKYLHVYEVHQAAGMYAQALLGRHGERSAEEMASLRYQTAAALQAASEPRIQEPSVAMVWDRLLAAELGVGDAARRADLVRRIVDFELEMELANLGLVEGAAELLKALKAQGKVVAAISDMYFDRAQMARVLGKLGILEYFDHLYVSAEVNLTKQTGDLFRQVVADLGIAPAQMLHVGDNPQSDIAMATAAGLPCVQVEQFDLLGLERSAFGQRERIEQEVADILKAHLFSVLMDSLSRGVDQLWFLARDGLAIRNFLEAWDSPLRDAFLPVPEHGDLHLNRVLTCWANVDLTSANWLADAIGIAFWLKEGKATAAELGALLGVEEVPAVLGTGVLSAAADTWRVADAFRNQGLEDAVRAAVLGRRLQVERYLADIGFFERKSAALVDVGYSGTVARSLATLLAQARAEGRELDPPAMVLHLIATFDNYEVNREAAQPLVEFADSAVLPVDSLPEELRGYSWIELFFKHPSLLPILGFVERDGRIVPELREGEPFPGETPAQRVARFATGRDEDIVFLWMAATGKFEALRDPVLARFARPDPATIDQMRDEIFELDPVAGTRRSILLELPDADRETVAAAARKGDYWIAGSLAASRHAATRPQAAAAAAPQGGLWRRLLRRKRPAPEELRGFDPQFYRDFYPDLRHLTSDAQLARHYLNHGRAERRLGSRLALETRLLDECGPIPDDFQAEAYLAYNPDVARELDRPERALDHYMRTGAREGRRYRPVLDTLVDAFDRFRAEGRIVLDEVELRLHQRGTSTFQLFLARHGVHPGRWIDEIVVPEFRAMHAQWAGPVANRAECILALCERGLTREPAPALAFNAPFDPEFYRAQVRADPALAALAPADLAPAELYRHYLARGCSAGLAPSEAAALYRLWGHREFPACFDWEGWRADRERSHPDGLPAANRLAVLKAFLEADDTAGASRVRGEGAAYLLANAAQRAMGRAQPDIAIGLLQAALAVDGDHGWIHHLLGDYLNATAETAKALGHYRRGTQTGSPNRWSYINAANMLLNQGDHRAALAILADGRAAWQETAPWRAVHARAIDVWADACARRLAVQPVAAWNTDEAEAIAAEVAGRLPEAMPVAPAAGSGLLVFTSRPASARREDADLHPGITVVQLAPGQTADWLGALLRHDRVVFHEVALCNEVLRALFTARRLGRKTTVWLGDLAPWEGHATGAILWGERGEESGALTAERAVHGALLARWCDGAVVTLAGCTPLLRAAAPGLALTDLTGQPARLRGPAPVHKVVLVTVDNTARTAEVDRLAEVLTGVAACNPALEFIVDKRLAARPAFAALAGRQALLDPEPHLPDLARMIGLADLVVSLAGHPVPAFAPWVEARARGVPALVIALDRPHGASWPAEVALAGSDPVAAILHAAQGPVAAPEPRPEPHPHRAAPADAARPAAPPAAPRRRRVLVTNIWAPPQVIGGATRVLKDNVDYFLDAHADEFDLALFASDEHNDRSGQFTMDSYRGVPVFRVGTPQEENVYWRPRNAQAAARFGAVLDSFRPDLVHFHCLQKLGVGLPEECLGRGLPYFVTLHDGWWLSDHFFLADPDAMWVPAREDFLDQPRAPAFGATRSALRAQDLRAALHGAERRLAVSGRFGQIYADCGFSVDVVENGVSRLPAAPDGHASARDRVQLCHIGGLEPHKGAFLVEAALQAHPFAHLELTIVDLAQGPDYRFHTRWGSTPVTVVGRMAADDLARFFAGMDVLLAPSTCEESFGLVVREGLAHGLWIVTGDRGAMSEPIRHGENGFVVPVTDGAALAEVLGQIDADPPRFRAPPPLIAPLRTADDQSRDLVELYRTVPLRGEAGASED